MEQTPDIADLGRPPMATEVLEFSARSRDHGLRGAMSNLDHSVAEALPTIALYLDEAILAVMCRDTYAALIGPMGRVM